MTRILVVEDDPSILRGIADNLAFENYEVVTAADGETGLRLLREEHPDLVILDLMLPRLSGHELCRRARKERITTPIIMITARGEESDRIAGLDLGADDYVTKPFAIGELLARVRAVLRRVGQPAAEPDELRFDDVRVDFRSYEAERAGRPVAMTPKEFALLRHLSARPSEVVRRDALLDEVWGYGSDVTTRTVDNHVASLRAKLEQDAQNPRHLLTVHRVGYRWMP
jgi:DNA-binding response OmpR family regulator